MWHSNITLFFKRQEEDRSHFFADVKQLDAQIPGHKSSYKQIFHQYNSKVISWLRKPLARGSNT